MEIETLWHKNINFPRDFLLKLTASKPDYNTKNAKNSLLKIQFFPREFWIFFPGNWESQNPEFPGNSHSGNSQCGTPSQEILTEQSSFWILMMFYWWSIPKNKWNRKLDSFFAPLLNHKLICYLIWLWRQTKEREKNDWIGWNKYFL